MTEKKRGLGRGLEALLGSTPNPTQLEQVQVSTDGDMKKLSIELLRPGVYQPRNDMSPDLLEELASSIRAHGVIQPIIVRRLADGYFEIIAGERRWRASQLAGLTEVPVIVRDINDEAAGAMALIENIQREDLNAMEAARGLQRLIEDFGLTHQEVASAVGKSRTTVTNLLRLMGLEESVKTLVERGDLDMGHARALLALSGEAQSQVAKIVVAKDLSVRETERLVKAWQKGQPSKSEESSRCPDMERLINGLSERLGAEVNIKHQKSGKGTLVIHYNSLDELEGVMSHIQ